MPIGEQVYSLFNILIVNSAHRDLIRTSLYLYMHTFVSKYPDLTKVMYTCNCVIAICGSN